MEDEQILVARFLAEPESAVACGACVAWLETRHDPRGEYLHLLSNAAELHDPGAGDRVHRLLYLRLRIDSTWADQVDCTRIATRGVYQSDPIDGVRHYLRLYPDGSIISVCSSQTAIEAWQRFDQAKDDRAFGRGVYKLVGGKLRFSLLQEPRDSMWKTWKALFEKRLDEDIVRDFDFIAAAAGIRQHARELAEQMKRTDYAGAPSRRNLCLNWHKHMDDSRGTMSYWFAATSSPE